MTNLLTKRKHQMLSNLSGCGTIMVNMVTKALIAVISLLMVLKVVRKVETKILARKGGFKGNCIHCNKHGHKAADCFAKKREEEKEDGREGREEKREGRREGDKKKEGKGRG